MFFVKNINYVLKTRWMSVTPPYGLAGIDI